MKVKHFGNVENSFVVDLNGPKAQIITVIGDISIGVTNSEKERFKEAKLYIQPTKTINISFDLNWKWASSVPTQIEDGKLGILELTSFNEKNSDVIANFSILDPSEIEIVSGLQFDPVAANPGNTTTLWANSSDGNKLYYGASEVGGGAVSVPTFNDVYGAESGVHTITMNDGNILYDMESSLNKLQFRSSYLGVVGTISIQQSTWAGYGIHFVLSESVGGRQLIVAAENIQNTTSLTLQSVNNLNLRVTSGNVRFRDQNLSAYVPISETGVAGLVGFTATSIVGALNELRALH